MLTFEIENVNMEALLRLKQEQVNIFPDPEVLQMIKDKGLQKRFYQNHNIPTAAFQILRDRESVIQSVSEGKLQFPFVQKLCKGGYDGRGVNMINNKDDLQNLFEGESVVEQKVAVQKEIAVIGARNQKGEVKTFPAVEMVFDPKANLVDHLICPSGIDKALAEKADKITVKLLENLHYTGLLAVEFFVDANQQLMVNEIAPRPHNSGHHTIEGVITSQYEQHLRGILNLPLGSTHLKMPVVMINLLGEEGYHGPVKYEGLTESMAIEGVKIHIYGKKITWPKRKMGHVTVMDSHLEKAIEKAEKVKQTIKVKAWKNQV